ncbi:hypothetical protein R52603_02329 [Paraburkholderia saeva]|nr:hypothetical protein R70241_00877 [Paraburkholderia saeva]CAG4897594.1 hypothetical protein R52603_02329 [Paraburkholderia saeva]
MLGLKPGEAAVIRNVGGRVNKSLLEKLAVLSASRKQRDAQMVRAISFLSAV